jgi:hypothetical protein
MEYNLVEPVPGVFDSTGSFPIFGRSGDFPGVIDVDFTKDPTRGGNNDNDEGQDFLEMILKGILREPATISSDPTVRTSRPSQLSTPGSSVSAVKSDSGDMLLSAIKAFATPKSLI